MRSLRYVAATVAAIACLYPACASGKTVKVDSSRLIKVMGNVGSDTAMAAKELNKLAMKGRGDIYILINSPGGEVISGILFINAMQRAKARGIKLRCIATGVAASMAYHILAQCQHRYAMNTTLLLFHEIRVRFGFGGGTVTQDDSLSMYRQFRIYAKYLDKVLMREMGISRKSYNYYNRRNIVWIGRELDNKYPKFLDIIDDVVGVSNIYDM